MPCGDPWLISGAPITKPGPAEPITHHHMQCQRATCYLGHDSQLSLNRQARDSVTLKPACTGHIEGYFHRWFLRSTRHISLCPGRDDGQSPLPHTCHRAQRRGASTHQLPDNSLLLLALKYQWTQAAGPQETRKRPVHHEHSRTFYKNGLFAWFLLLSVNHQKSSLSPALCLSHLPALAPSPWPAVSPAAAGAGEVSSENRKPRPAP